MGEPRRVHVATFGCRVNQADSEGIMGTLVGRGLALADDHRAADVVVINSCTVTHRSDADIRKLVARVHRDNPAARVVVTGCYAQRDPQALARIPGTSAVVGHSDAGALGAVVMDLLEGPPPALARVLRAPLERIDPATLAPLHPVSVLHDRTRPFVKIQDGCDAHCTYCVIPQVRGPARSAAADRVLDSVAALVHGGAFEVVLAGIHLGTYGGRADGAALAELVERALAIPGLGRLRLSAIEPMAFPRALIALAAREPRLAPHFHLPLQSGADRVLKRMARPYRARDYAELLQAVRTALPDACLGTDVIVGFPGETDADFAETLAFVDSAGLDHVHVFSYSDRPGVPATRLDDKVDPAVIKARAAALIALSGRRWARFLDRWVGRRVRVLTLARDPRRPDEIPALSAAYVPVRVASAALAPNEAVEVELVAREGDALRGVVVPGQPITAARAAAVRSGIGHARLPVQG